MLPNVYQHPSLSLDPAQWAETLKRKAAQDAADRAIAAAKRQSAGKIIPTLEMI